MEDFINEINQREEVFKFIKNSIELEAQKLYTKEYNVDFLFEDLLNDRLSEVVSHFNDRIDENQVTRFSHELANSSNDFKGRNELYGSRNKLEFLLEE